MSDYITADTHIDETTKMLVFDSEGYVTGGSSTWEDVHLTVEMQYTGGVFGIAPRIFDTNMYMFLHMRNEIGDEGESISVAHLGMQIAEDTTTLDEKTMPVLEEDKLYTIEVFIRKTNFRIVIDGETIFNIEYGGASKGYVGAFSTPGNMLKSIEVEALFPDGWTTNAGELNGGIASIERFSNMDKYFRLIQEDDTPLWLKQTIDGLESVHQTLSFNGEGTGTVAIKESDTVTHRFEINQSEWDRIEHSVKLSPDTTAVEIIFETQSGALSINDVQLEPRPVASSYIHNESSIEKKSRGPSIITYPEKENIQMDAGTILMWVNPSINHSESGLNPVLFETGQQFQISYREHAFWFRYGNAVVFHPYTGSGEWVHVAVKWEMSQIAIYVNGESSTMSIGEEAPVSGKLLHIGHSSAGQNEVNDSVIKSLKLSGGNLLPSFHSDKWGGFNSNVEVLNEYTLFNSGENASPTIARITIDVEPNTDYTISSYSDYGRTNVWGYIDGEDNGEVFHFVPGTFSRTFNTGDNNEIRITLGRFSQELNDITFSHPMLTKGTEEHPWSPSPIETALAVLKNTEPNIFTGMIDEVVVLRSPLDESAVLLHYEAEEPIANDTSMIMRATFNYAIGNFDRSIVEMPGIPDYGSPVLIEKADGRMMRKVSFFDIQTGEYRTYNTEAILFPDTRDYLELSYIDSEIDTDSFDIQVRDAEGNIWGMPYELAGNRLYMTIQDEDREHIDAVQFEGELTRQHLYGKYLYVTYQLKHSYTVDFNIDVPDAFRVTMGDHDGTDVTVAYEGNRHTDDKLLTMVDLNPMMNPNHEGFLYVTKNVEPVTSIRASASPETLSANGASESLIVVEPLDANGNHISHVNIAIEATEGVIVPVYDSGSVRLRDMAGRYLYRYHAPILTMEQTGKVEVRDDINIMDTESGIGIQLPMRLKSMVVVYHQKQLGDTLESIAESNGTNTVDIAYTQNMLDLLKARGIEDTAAEDQVISAARTYIRDAAVGTIIEVPINHSARNLSESMQLLEMQRMAGEMAEVVIHNMKRHAEGILQSVDFNDDGMITMEEIEWLNNPENREQIPIRHSIFRDAIEEEVQ